MATAVNMFQLLDSPIALKIGGDIDRTLTQNISETLVDGEGALLTWNARRVGNGSVTYEVSVNGVLSKAYTTSLGDWSAVQESIHTDNIHQGDNNVVFKVTTGTATLEFSDTMLFIRKNA